MTIPAAQFIEAALDQQAAEAPAITAKKKHELESAAWEKSQDPAFVSGYLLGLATAEFMLASRGEKL